jgi:hypothetical protein
MNELTTVQSLPCFRKLSANQCGLSQPDHSHGASGISVARALTIHRANEYRTSVSTADRFYFPSAEYPRGFVGGNALKLHFFFPHFEHRIRFSTFSSRASQPHNRPSICGSAVRSWPQAEHLRTKVY